MAITRLSNSGIKTGGVLKYDTALAGYPPVMAAPTATDAGTGTSVNVAFTAVSGATSYTAISTPGSFTATGASSPLTVTGLSSGTAYTFQVRATNAVGTGPYSAASNSVTPVVPSSYESIATINVSSSTNLVTFSSIPQTFQHLQIRYTARKGITGSGFRSVSMRYNGITSAGSYNSNYWRTYVGGADAGTFTGSSQDYLRWLGDVPDTSNFIVVGIIDINDYTTTDKWKPFKALSHSMATSNGRAYMCGGSNRFNNAITSITLAVAEGSENWTWGTFALYGIKGS